MKGGKRYNVSLEPYEDSAREKSEAGEDKDGFEEAARRQLHFPEGEEEELEKIQEKAKCLT